jgi:hypothetical protein
MTYHRYLVVLPESGRLHLLSNVGMYKGAQCMGLHGVLISVV